MQFLSESKQQYDFDQAFHDDPTRTNNLTIKGQKVLAQIKKNQSKVFSTVTESLGLSVDQGESFKQLLGNAIGFFDDLLGLDLNEPSVLRQLAVVHEQTATDVQI